MHPYKNKIKPLAWIIIIGGTISIVVISFVLYQHTVNLLTTNLQQRIESIARSAAPAFDPKDLEELQMELDWQKPAWGKVVNQLLAIEQSHDDILFAYIFRKKTDNPSIMEFVADSHSINPFANTDDDSSNNIDANRDGKIEPDGPDYLQWPGQEKPDILGSGTYQDTFRAYSGPTASNELYEDSFGRVITGYAPIVSDGETIAVLAFDMKADDFFKITRQTLYPFLGFISVLVLIILSLFYVIVRMWGKQLQNEIEQRERIEEEEEALGVINKKLKALDKQKTEFVSMASHQLRSPLTAIKGYSSMLLEGSFGPLAGKTKDAVSVVFQSSQKLVTIIEDFLNITRIELGTMKYTITELDLAKVAKTVVDELKMTIEGKGLKIVFNAEPGEYKIKADLGKISQVMGNIIDNAAKYTPDGSIAVSVKRAGNKIRFETVDTGVGIDPEVMPKLFQKFMRADDAGRINISGTGQGLYVAKQLLEGQGGKIWAESAGKNQGATFIVEMPAIK